MALAVVIRRGNELSIDWKTKGILSFYFQQLVAN